MNSDTAQTKETKLTASKLSTKDIVFIGIFAAIMAICSWISIPFTVPFTLQTFAVFLAVLLLGGKRGTIAVLVYILLGAVGIPVFSGFKGGLGVLMGSTGGYIIGFIFTALIMWFFESKSKNIANTIISMLLGLLVCYAFGTVWFMYVYNNGTDTPASISMILGWCVIPFIIPDLVKIFLALLISRNKAVKNVLR